MVEPKWIKIEENTWAMNVPDGVVMRYVDNFKNVAAMAHVPATTLRDVGGKPYLESTKDFDQRQCAR